MHAGHFHHDIAMYASPAALCVLAAVLYAAAAVAQSPQPVLTAADVRRIALASAPDAASSSRFAATSGLQQAKALGIPIDTMAISRDPTLAKVRGHWALLYLPVVPAYHARRCGDPPVDVCAPYAACMRKFRHLDMLSCHRTGDT